jgi:tRNA1Val (adenine37-N6)-methyltransferase
MANTYFQFKQFRVEQDRCAMKVCTDACIQGAYTRATETAKHLLDIGTGTGLLSLMLAQRHPHLLIDAVEIEPIALEQARQNVVNSPWASAIRLHQTDIRYFNPEHRYELIISNPPFYPAHLRSDNQRKNQAHHHDSLSFEALAAAVKRLLAAEGVCSILLPPRQAQEFSQLAEKEGLFMQHELVVQESAAHNPHRSIRFYSHSHSHSHKKSPSIDRLIIRDEEGNYSSQFRQLLQPYYLHF